jgi:hypothetical protein
MALRGAGKGKALIPPANTGHEPAATAVQVRVAAMAAAEVTAGMTARAG